MAKFKESTLQRTELIFTKLYDKGITTDQAKKFTIKQWNDTFESNIKKQSSLNAQKRLLKVYEKVPDKIADVYIDKRNITNEQRIEFIHKDAKRLTKVPVPEKFEIPKYEIPTKEGKFATGLITDLETGNEFWIKYTSQKDIDRQIADLQNPTNLPESLLSENYSFEFAGYHVYREFTDMKFKDLLEFV